MSPSCTVVIPARFGSSRFPGKPLALLDGRPVVAHVAARALAAGVGRVIVATDDARIAAAAGDAGAETLQTRPDHPSGTDRVAEVARRLGLRGVVLNVQGDEPRIEAAALRRTLALFEGPEVCMATAAAPLAPADATSPDVVKVVIDAAGRALYFSRARIPSGGDGLLRHVGIYGYRASTLLRLASLPPCALELQERLEQLRALFNGIAIHVAKLPHAWGGVDTPADLEALQRASERSTQ